MLADKTDMMSRRKMRQQVLKEDTQLENKSPRSHPRPGLVQFSKRGRMQLQKPQFSSNASHTLTHRQPFPTFRERDEKHKHSWAHKWWTTPWRGCLSDHCLPHRQQLLIKARSQTAVLVRRWDFALRSSGREQSFCLPVRNCVFE